MTMVSTDGCETCGMAYSFVFEAQFHRPDCRQAEFEAKQSHVCEDNPVPYVSDGALGHGWECGECGRFLQAG